MDPKLSAFALFCDSVREEKGGLNTIVGVMPDNVEVPAFPGAFTRLSVHYRVIIPIGFEIKPVTLTVALPNTPKLEMGFETSLIEAALRNSSEQGNPSTTLVGSFTVNNIQIPEPMKINALVRCGDAEILAGYLNIKRRSPPPTAAG